MRSWLSERKTSHDERPGSFSGAFSRNRAPPVPLSISPAADENPPAPQSVTNSINPSSRASRMKSAAFFSSIGLPICTAPWSSAWLLV